MASVATGTSPTPAARYPILEKSWGCRDLPPKSIYILFKVKTDRPGGVATDEMLLAHPSERRVPLGSDNLNHHLNGSIKNNECGRGLYQPCQ